MQTEKMRVFVEAPPITPGGVRRRLVVPILRTKTVADFAEVVARRIALNNDSASDLTLTLADGSMLFPEDEIQDVVQAEDVVHINFAHNQETGNSYPILSPNSNTQPTSSTNPPQMSRDAPEHRRNEDTSASFTSSSSEKRVRIALVTPKLARNVGNADIAREMAFGGSAVSVKLTMDIVRREAARTLGWLENHDVTDVDRPTNSACDHIHGSCACTVANQIVAQGRFEQFHCPREIDGTVCDDTTCPYSHAAMASGDLTGHIADIECKICTELFGFACEKCLQAERDVDTTANVWRRYCPLVQNAGCKHIFHAHCYFAKTFRSQGCPAGCTTSSIGVEAIPFDMQVPHLVVVHSGSIVEKVPIPMRYLAEHGAQIELTDEDVMNILASKYSDLGPGLVVRMYGRKLTGMVSFRHSTVVSICCASRHDVDGIQRFALNGPPLPVLSSRSAVDLHTAFSPILNEAPYLTIEDLMLDYDIPDGDEIVLYVNKRPKINTKPNTEQRVGKAAVYTARDDWQPVVRQTDRGMAAFLSSLLVFANYLSVAGNSNEEKNMQNRVLNHLLALTRFPLVPVRALYILTLNESLLPEEMHALSETVYHLALDVSHPFVTKGDLSRAFEGARVLFGVLIERTKGVFTFPESDVRASQSKLFSKVLLSCGLSGEPLDDAVLYGDILVNRAAVSIRRLGGVLFDPSVGTPEVTPVPIHVQRLIQSSGRKTSQLIVFNDSVEPVTILTHSLRPSTLAAGIDKANVELQIHAPLSLREVVTPALTLDEVGFNAVYIARAAPCSDGGEDGFLLRPCHGGEVGLDVNLVATKLQPIIERRKAIGEWDIDAFGASRTDRLDTREIEEAIVVALDVSRSMEQKFDGDSDDEDSQVDFDEIALNKAMEEFSKRHHQASDALMQAKMFLASLDCLASVTRYICHGETTLHSGSGRQPRVRAEEALKELVVIYSRMHSAQFRVMEFAPIRSFNLSRWEDFIAVATDNLTKPQLLTYLVQQAAAIKENENLLASNGVPKRFIDPLSGEVMVDPVRASDGVIYERSRINAWLEHRSTSPMDPTVLINSTLVAISSLHNPIRTFLGGRPRASLQQHQQPLLIRVKTMWGRVLEYVLNTEANTILSVLFENWLFTGRAPSVSCLWHGLTDCGDGSMRGRRLEPASSLRSLPSQMQVFRSTEGLGFSLDVVELNHRVWRHVPDNADRIRKDSRSMSRLDIVKQAFEAFVNKSEAFDHPIAIGLVTFGRQVHEVQDLTLLKERFRDSLRTIMADGDTPLFDSLSVAHSMLQTFKAEHPTTALRIICLTDGCDVGSSTLPHQIAKKLQRSKITVDSLVVQTGDLTNVLHPISVVTGGYSFKIDTLENALNIVELETVLRMKDRLERPRQPIVRNPWRLLEYNDLSKYPLDIVTADECPDRKPHARLHEPLLAASSAAARALPPSTDRQRRLMQELREVMNSPHPAIDVYSGSDLAFWKIVIEAPKGSPYEGGTFLAYVDFGSNYPQSAPEVRFITPILHPNINRHGKVCHAALDRSWVVDMTMKVILQVLYGILLTPDTDNPLDLHATMEYNDDTGIHAQRVHEMVQRHALKTRAEWKEVLEAED